MEYKVKAMKISNNKSHSGFEKKIIQHPQVITNTATCVMIDAHSTMKTPNGWWLVNIFSEQHYVIHLKPSFMHSTYIFPSIAVLTGFAMVTSLTTFFFLL